MAYLIDHSALTRGRTRPEVRAVLAPLLASGMVATCAIADLEILYSAEGPADHRVTTELLRSLPRAPVDEKCAERALEVQGLLAKRSEHRGVSLPDLLIAACAERAELTVLHYDADYDLIASVTDQPTRWVVPRGSVS